MALDVRETYLRDRSVHSYFSRVLLDALSVPPLGQVLGVGLGPVGLMLASWALLGALLGIFDTFLNAFESFWCLWSIWGGIFNVFSLRFSLILRDVSFIRGYCFAIEAIATSL